MISQEIINQNIENHVQYLLQGDHTALLSLDRYIQDTSNQYEGSLKEYAFREAIRRGITEYIKSKANEMELNDGDECSSYLYETHDPAIQLLLVNRGAKRKYEDYTKWNFVMESFNNEIIWLRRSLQEEALGRYLEKNQLVKDNILYGLESNTLEAPLLEDLNALGVTADEGKFCFTSLLGEDGEQLLSILENLGWESKREGIDYDNIWSDILKPYAINWWNGIYYIE